MQFLSFLCRIDSAHNVEVIKNVQNEVPEHSMELKILYLLDVLVQYRKTEVYLRLKKSGMQ